MSGSTSARAFSTWSRSLARRAFASRTLTWTVTCTSQHGRRGELVQRELHPHVTRLEAEPLVEPVGVPTARVGGQLHEPTTPFPRPLDRPLDEPLAQAVAALVGTDADRLDRRPRHAGAREPRGEGDLEGVHDLAGPLDHREDLVRVGVDLLEGAQVAGVTGLFTGGAELVVRDQLHDRGNVLGRGTADLNGHPVTVPAPV